MGCRQYNKVRDSYDPVSEMLIGSYFLKLVCQGKEVQLYEAAKAEAEK